MLWQCCHLDLHMCLLVNVALWEEPPQRTLTLHIVGRHSLDRLQIVGVGRLHISNKLWRLPMGIKKTDDDQKTATQMINKEDNDKNS